MVRVGWKWLPARLEPCALLVGGGYLRALVVRALVVGAGWKWLPAYLGACALVTFSGPAKFVPWCVVTCML